MLEALSSLAGNDTPELMLQNYKKFILGSRSVGIVQIETALPDEILTRTDLLPALSSLRSQEHVHHILLSVVNLAASQTHLITDTPDSKQLLEQALCVRFAGDLAIVPRMMMRKTDLVPGLGAYLENLDQGRK
jgi:inorganic pyrophosphatase/exopolyphosphatase